MHWLRILLCLFSITVVQGWVADSIDNSGSGDVESSDFLNSNDPIFKPDPLNLLVDNSGVPSFDSNAAVIPEIDKTNPGSNPDPPKSLAYSLENLNDFSKSSMGSESYSNGPFSNSDALNSESLDSSGIVVPNFNPSDLFYLDSPNPAAPVENPESDGSLASNPTHDLISLQRTCVSDNSATGGDKEIGGSCVNPRKKYHRKPGQESEADETEAQQKKDIQQKGRRDAAWKKGQISKGANVLFRTTGADQKKCNIIGGFFGMRLIPMCCLGPSRIFAVQQIGTFSFSVSDEENCGYNWPERPICLALNGYDIDINSAFCCQKFRTRGSWGLYQGLNCVPMLDTLVEAIGQATPLV